MKKSYYANMDFMKKVMVIGGLLILLGVGFYFYKNTKVSDTDQISRKDTGAPAAEKENENTHFSKFNSIFRFSADLPEGLEASYVPEIESVNISDKIFIRYFQANDFLTLSTVDKLQTQPKKKKKKKTNNT